MFGLFKRKAAPTPPPPPMPKRVGVPSPPPAPLSPELVSAHEAREGESLVPQGEFGIHYTAQDEATLSDIARAGARSQGFSPIELPATIRVVEHGDSSTDAVVYVLNEKIGYVDEWWYEPHPESARTLRAKFLLIAHRQEDTVTFGTPSVWIGDASPTWSDLRKGYSYLEKARHGYFMEAALPPHLVTGEFEATMLNAHGRNEVSNLVSRIPLDEGEVAEIEAILKRGLPQTEFPRHLVIEVEGDPVGRIFSDDDDEFKRLTEGDSVPVILRIEVRDKMHGHARVSGAIWAGTDRPEWSAETLKPWSVHLQESSDARAARRAQERKRATDALNDETHPVSIVLRTGRLPAQATPQDLIEPINELKREKRWEDALTMLYAAIESEERTYTHNGGIPAPWYTEHAAICHRRLKQHEDEVAVLKRYLTHLTPEQRATSKIQARLTKIETG